MAPTPKYGCHDTIRMRLIYQMYTYLTGAQPVVCRHPFTGRWPRRQVGPTEDLAHPAPFRSDALLLSTRYARRLRSSPAAQRRASDRRHTRGQGSREECRGDLMTGATNNQTCCSAMPLGATVDLRSPRLESPVLRRHSRPRRGLLPPHRWRSPLPRTAV